MVHYRLLDIGKMDNSMCQRSGNLYIVLSLLQNRTWKRCIHIVRLHEVSHSSFYRIPNNNILKYIFVIIFAEISIRTKSTNWIFCCCTHREYFVYDYLPYGFLCAWIIDCILWECDAFWPMHKKKIPRFKRKLYN